MVSAASAGQIVSGNVYDVWWAHGGANRICVAMSAASGGGGGWSSDTSGSNTARGTGFSQLDTTTRSYITNKNSITNCFNAATNYGPISANQGTYLGTIYASANGQVSWTFGSVASNCGAGQFGVYNLNQELVGTYVGDSTGSWSSSVSANVWRQAHGSATCQVSMVRGLNESGVSAQFAAISAAGSGTFTDAGIGLDSTTAFIGIAGYNQTNSPVSGLGSWSGAPGIGYHTIVMLELNSTTTASTWYGNPNGGTQSGMTVNFSQ
jgi:hypothetical protein